MINKVKRRASTVVVINEHNKALILRRGSTAPWMPGKYCLPGGHIEHNEDAAYAAVRELSEETGLVYPVDELKYVTIVYNEDYSKIVYVAHINEPKVILNFEHDDYRWVSYKESFDYELVPRLSYTLKTLYRKNYIV